MQLLPGTEGNIEDYSQFIMDTVKPKLESIDGVAGVEINAGAPEELQITIDPYRAAEYGIELGDQSQHVPADRPMSRVAL